MFERIGKFLGNAACGLGMHEGEWVYIEANNCTQTRTCVRCRHVDTREAHSFGTWHYFNNQSCHEERICIRCNETEYTRDEAHQMGEWVYTQPGECHQIQTCTRCGSQKQREHHVHGVWEYESPVSCKQVRYCRRCHDKEAGQTLHKWGEWQSVATGAKRRCAHCGHEEHQSISQ